MPPTFCFEGVYYFIGEEGPKTGSEKRNKRAVQFFPDSERSYVQICQVRKEEEEGLATQPDGGLRENEKRISLARSFANIATSAPRHRRSVCSFLERRFNARAVIEALFANRVEGRPRQHFLWANLQSHSSPPRRVTRMRN